MMRREAGDRGEPTLGERGGLVQEKGTALALHAGPQDEAPRKALVPPLDKVRVPPALQVPAWWGKRDAGLLPLPPLLQTLVPCPFPHMPVARALAYAYVCECVCVCLCVRSCVHVCVRERGTAEDR